MDTPKNNLTPPTPEEKEKEKSNKPDHHKNIPLEYMPALWPLW